MPLPAAECELSGGGGSKDLRRGGGTPEVLVHQGSG